MKSSSLLASSVASVCFSVILSACSTMSASGPSSRDIAGVRDASSAGADIKIVDVTDAVTRQILAAERKVFFSQNLGEGKPVGSTVGRGDVLDISIWEAPPAALFGTGAGDLRLAAVGASAHGTNLPEQMVDSDGRIAVPFVGSIQAAGRTPSEISAQITARLIGKAHQPQTIVRLVRNAAATVTVVGDVANSARIPLTAKGERILDALATAGGVKQSVSKTLLQITRGQKVATMPLEMVIRDPRENVLLQPDDVMTVLFQPFSFIALGATGKNEEIPIEATGITLAQALGRVSGLQDSRADVKGVFLFRLENPENLGITEKSRLTVTADGKIPVIYRINLKNPATFFIAQSFPIHDKDVLYVSNAPLADFQKFVNVIFSTMLPVATIAGTLN